MDDLEMLRQLLAYNEWADCLTVESLKQSAESGSQAMRAFIHLLVAEREWLSRMVQNIGTAQPDFWPELSLAECERLASEVHEAYAGLLGGLSADRLDEVATYRNSKGIEYRTKWRDIFVHVTIHSAYHRGQVAMALRASGGVPAYTDYIAFVREQDSATAL